MIIDVKTPKHNFKVEVLSKFVKTKDIVFDKEKFAKMCKDGCINYGKKYSCPPYSPSFDVCTKDYPEMLVVMMNFDLSQLDKTKYNNYFKVQVANAILKSKIEKLMRYLSEKHNTKFLATGSCRLCKPCKLKKQEPCAHPDKKMFSLESTGVDCNDLTKKTFNKELLWYKDKKAPKYTSVVCSMLVNDQDKDSILKDLKLFFEN